MTLLATKTSQLADAGHDELRAWWMRFEDVFEGICGDARHRERIQSIWRESDTTRLRGALRALSLRLEACTDVQAT